MAKIELFFWSWVRRSRVDKGHVFGDGGVGGKHGYGSRVTGRLGTLCLQACPHRVSTRSLWVEQPGHACMPAPPQTAMRWVLAVNGSRQRSFFTCKAPSPYTVHFHCLGLLLFMELTFNSLMNPLNGLGEGRLWERQHSPHFSCVPPHFLPPVQLGGGPVLVLTIG